MKIITLSPLRAFLPGEVIAVADEEQATTSKGKTALRYGVVVGTSSESDNTLKRVQIIVKPGVRKMVVSSEIYAFTRSSSTATPGNLLRKRSSEDVSMLVTQKIGGEDDVDVVGPTSGHNENTVNPLDNAKYIQAVEDILSKVN